MSIRLKAYSVHHLQLQAELHLARVVLPRRTAQHLVSPTSSDMSHPEVSLHHHEPDFVAPCTLKQYFAWCMAGCFCHPMLAFQRLCGYRKCIFSGCLSGCQTQWAMPFSLNGRNQEPCSESSARCPVEEEGTVELMYLTRTTRATS